MLALRFDGALFLDRGSAPPHAGAGEALVRVRVAGICSTDLEIVSGYKGFTGVLGHEFVGEVVGGGNAHWIGKRVCGEINVVCGHCQRCISGQSGHCSGRTVLGILGRDGVFADFVALPTRNLHSIPETVSDDEAVFVEPLAAAFQVLEQVTFRRGDRVTVLGDGKLGLLCAQVLALTGARVQLVGKHPDKMAILSHRGIDVNLLGSEKADSMDIVVEASGTGAGLETAIRMLRPRGALVLKSTIAKPYQVDLSEVAVKELTILGSRCGPFKRAINALVERTVEVESLISGRFPLVEGLAAMGRASEEGVLKILLDM